MSQMPQIRFLPLDAPLGAVTVVTVGKDLQFGEVGKKLDSAAKGGLARAAEAGEFKGKERSAIEVLGAAGIDPKRVILLGVGAADSHTDHALMRLGGTAWSRGTSRSTEALTIVADWSEITPAGAARLAEGVTLRAYTFKKYQTRKSPDEENGSGGKALRVDIHCADPDAAAKAYEARAGVAEGVYLARDLVNEPANALGPLEFADRLASLGVPGLEVEVMDAQRLHQLGMGALLAVAQGSAREARVVVMHWQGAKGRGKSKAPLCFVGKGVVFDTGGISMKPAGGMEDMKGDMGGAACVSGLMLALARRKANVNAVGIVGLVENMPSGTATRPGDIVTSMSGQTIEILNTDAEGRLVLADLLHYAQETLKPRLIVDLATLTGAIMVALGKEYAGLFSNNDRLVKELEEAGEATGEKVWHMPLAPAYDKMIASKNADMKNIGGRLGGAITAAQFLQRFIKDKSTPWAHLDVAGTAMDSTRDEINQSWGSGWGVRLLDTLVAQHYSEVGFSANEFWERGVAEILLRNVIVPVFSIIYIMRMAGREPEGSFHGGSDGRRPPLTARSAVTLMERT
ncbi:MAG: leucyl aminopeptidase [Hyphomicrobiaceae bacterium]